MALLVLCAGIRRFFGSREDRPRRSRRDNAGCCRSWGGARGRWGPVSWSVAAAFDRQGKAIGCEPPARDERVCPPGGEPSRVDGYRSFSPSGRPGWVLPAANPYGVGVGTSCIWRGAGPAPPRIIKLYQIFPFKVNYGTIRMELWIGCAPYRLTVFVESDHRLHSIC